HWFTDWGRDTMIAMRGLTIATGKYEISKSILKTFLDAVQDGLLPNRFPDYSQDAVEYNNIDGALWLFQSLYEFYNQFKDADFIAHYLPVLNAILTHYSEGTRFNIHLTEEGLLYGGKPGWQLTWMDAKVDGEVITPRIGCPVEVNCLWYNALKIYDFFCELCKTSPAKEFGAFIKKFEKNFPAYFVNKKKTLYDVVIPGKMADNCCRPNQIYALSLPFTVIDKEIQHQIFEQMQQQLYTPYGLRTLSQNSGQYQGHYGGNQLQRDRAYHQGTVWPFLLEPYFAAYFKLNGVNAGTKKHVLDQLKPIVDHFYNDAGLNSISEVFDGDNPHSGKGCIQQAWSVAAILKLYTDYKLYEL
ncbi:MAG: glycogen debranching protein, partial [Flavobacteriaceae bacterium]|nr:glycogen debranching protein [Flavobacteriaceae bacterium]